MKTYSAKLKDIEKKWYVIDAEGLVVGRVASIIAKMLIGKHKPTYDPHMDCGDNIVVVNADKVYFTAKKAERNKGKMYYKHTGYMGGIKETTAGKILESAFPERVLKKSVQRMLAKNPLGRQRLTNLYVYTGENHPHEGQTPEKLDIAAMNRKNKKGN